ncbi:MAG: hypothetical protein ACQEXV_01095 [Bacillota bacterium]
MDRAQTVVGLAEVRNKVYRAVRTAAEGMGATVDIAEGPIYAERNTNKRLAALFQRNLEQLSVGGFMMGMSTDVMVLRRLVLLSPGR